MSKLIECVPNFSEGADPDLIEDIVAAIKSTKVLDIHSDPDHNRTVVTFMDEPKAVRQAAFELTQRAMQLLDVKQHSGQHPFIGVVDVIPFIPIKGISEVEVVKLAHGFGQELWDKLNLPVYFYGDAARKQERRELPAVRHGGFAGLKAEIELPERKPDIGQGLHLTAGAVSVGVRDFLIAYNVNLKTNDLSIARSIAKNIREKSGGLPGIRALGVELPSRGITQVTINIVDHKKTSLKKIYGEVVRWAGEYEVEIVGSELVGMVPVAAVAPGLVKELKLIAPPRVLPVAKV
ncbi:MAG: glutamate formimidoyltransferase [Candidatus Saganbacteria bacterium]|nr:glutamate formimidoyltransferase [Candidatus Saganbacteria bacterium]